VGGAYGGGFVVMVWGILYSLPQVTLPNPRESLLAGLVWAGYGALLGVPFGVLLQLIRRPKPEVPLPQLTVPQVAEPSEQSQSAEPLSGG